MGFNSGRIAKQRKLSKAETLNLNCLPIWHSLFLQPEEVAQGHLNQEHLVQIALAKWAYHVGDAWTYPDNSAVNDMVDSSFTTCHQAAEDHMHEERHVEPELAQSSGVANNTREHLPSEASHCRQQPSSRQATSRWYPQSLQTTRSMLACTASSEKHWGSETINQRSHTPVMVKSTPSTCQLKPATPLSPSQTTEPPTGPQTCFWKPAARPPLGHAGGPPLPRGPRISRTGEMPVARLGLAVVLLSDTG